MRHTHKGVVTTDGLFTIGLIRRRARASVNKIAGLAALTQNNREYTSAAAKKVFITTSTHIWMASSLYRERWTDEILFESILGMSDQLTRNEGRWCVSALQHNLVPLVPIIFVPTEVESEPTNIFEYVQYLMVSAHPLAAGKKMATDMRVSFFGEHSAYILQLAHTVVGVVTWSCTHGMNWLTK